MKRLHSFALVTAVLAAPALPARADAILDWNAHSARFVADAKLGTPPAVRAMAIVQCAAFDAVNAITGRHPAGPTQPKAAPGASAEAAVAAAHRVALAALLPSQAAAVEKAYAEAIAAIPEGPAKAAGIETGEKAARAVLAARAADATLPSENFRPGALPGAYVPTAAPAVPQWGSRKPWLMESPSQFRPEPPPSLKSVRWARDFAEVADYGAKSGALRTAEQTQVARFWEYSLPAIYHGVARSVATAPGRDLTANARLFAATSVAMDDALIAVFDAKYHYNFWRPVTAIRNADVDGNPATRRDPAWSSLIDSPMHPEYPSGHSILASAVAAVLEAEGAGGKLPALETRSPTADGATRRWTSAEAFAREVNDARVLAGIHYRFSVETGAEMGRRIGELAVRRFGRLPS